MARVLFFKDVLRTCLGGVTHRSVCIDDSEGNPVIEHDFVDNSKGRAKMRRCIKLYITDNILVGRNLASMLKSVGVDHPFHLCREMDSLLTDSVRNPLEVYKANLATIETKIQSHNEKEIHEIMLGAKMSDSVEALDISGENFKVEKSSDDKVIILGFLGQNSKGHI